jgi:hypothetical protein
MNVDGNGCIGELKTTNLCRNRLFSTDFFLSHMFFIQLIVMFGTQIGTHYCLEEAQMSDLSHKAADKAHQVLTTSVIFTPTFPFPACPPISIP